VRILSLAWECPQGFGGLSTFVRMLLPEMARRHDVTHVCLYGGEGATGARVVKLSCCAFDEEGGALVVKARALLSLSCAALGFLGSVDAVLGHDFHAAVAAAAAASLGKRAALYIHAPSFTPFEVLAAVASIPTATNSRLSQALLRQEGVEARVVYPAPPLRPVDSYPGKPAREEPLVVIPSRYQGNKHPKHILPALEELRARGYRFRVVVVGRGADLYRRELPDWVEVVSNATDAARDELYRSADIAIQVGFPEPFGLVALEAIAMGAPTLVSNQSGAAEVLPREAVYTKEDLAEKLEQLLADPRAREDLWWKERRAWIMTRTWADTWRELEELLQL